MKKSSLTEARRHRDGGESDRNDHRELCGPTAGSIRSGALGSGLPETVYEVTLLRRLERYGLSLQRQVSIPIEFEGERFDEGFRADMIVHGKVIAAHTSNS